MSIAPEPILRAGNDTVSWACIFCRNETLRDGVAIRILNDLMEAIHEIPRILINWEHHDIAEIRTHLGCFPASHWSNSPALVAYFDQRLREYGYDGNAG